MASSGQALITQVESGRPVSTTQPSTQDGDNYPVVINPTSSEPEVASAGLIMSCPGYGQPSEALLVEKQPGLVQSEEAVQLRTVERGAAGREAARPRAVGGSCPATDSRARRCWSRSSQAACSQRKLSSYGQSSEALLSEEKCSRQIFLGY